MTEYIKREVLSKIMNDIAGDETCPMNTGAGKQGIFTIECAAVACTPTMTLTIIHIRTALTAGQRWTKKTDKGDK